MARLQYQGQFDGVRALGVITVVACHFETWLAQGAFVAVDVFFVLSAYLITALLLREHQDSGRISLRQFYVRRIRRLGPALMMTCTGVLVAYLVSRGVPVRRETLLGVPSALTYMSDWLQAVRVDLGYMSHTWTLSAEEHFYVIWPVVIVGALARWRSHLTGIVLALTVVAIVYSALAEFVLDWSYPRRYMGPDIRAKDFLAGALIAVIMECSKTRLWRHRAVITVAGYISGAALVAWTFLVGEYTGLYQNGALLVTLLASLLVLFLVQQPTAWLSRALSIGVLTWIGRRSYAIYLFHYPILGLVRPLGLTVAAVVVPITSVALAALSYTYVESPIMRGRPIWPRFLGARRIMDSLTARSQRPNW